MDCTSCSRCCRRRRRRCSATRCRHDDDAGGGGVNPVSVRGRMPARERREAAAESGGDCGNVDLGPVPRQQRQRRRRQLRRSVLLLCSFLFASSEYPSTTGVAPTPVVEAFRFENRCRRQRRGEYSAVGRRREHPPVRSSGTDLFLYSVESEVEREYEYQRIKKELGTPEPANGEERPATTKKKRNGTTDPRTVDDGGGGISIGGDAISRASAASTKSSTREHRSMWRRRNARSAEEGIRREKTNQLSSILAKAAADSVAKAATPSPRTAARTIRGLIHALAEDVRDLTVEVDTRADTPLWDKHVDEIRIKFSRLEFKPLKMGGLDVDAADEFVGKEVLHKTDDELTYTVGRKLTDLSCADEAFSRIDADNSGTLDRDEIVEALTLAAGASVTTDDDDSDPESRSASSPSDTAFLKRLASELVALYDFNGDGVVDRYEYQSMVEDMATLREVEEEQQRKLEGKERAREEQDRSDGWFGAASNFISGLFGKRDDFDEVADGNTNGGSSNSLAFPSTLRINGDRNATFSPGGYSTQTAEEVLSIKTLGSITLSDLKLDLRRLLFGAIPFVKRITPGGPLILEPFTATIEGSFNREDIMNSFLLDVGLKRLVAQALKRRVRALRDLMDFAMFYGRTWKITGKTAPLVEVLELTDVEFDKYNKMIITGRVRVQPSADSPIVENSFKLRTKLGTRLDGRVIRLVEPELALVLECPKLLEEK